MVCPGRYIHRIFVNPDLCVTGLCMLTVGTDDRSTIEWDGVKLLSAHSYAIIGILQSIQVLMAT